MRIKGPRRLFVMAPILLLLAVACGGAATTAPTAPATQASEPTDVAESPAPTATVTLSESRCSWIHCSCLGMPSPTRKTSGRAWFISATMASSSSGVNVLNGGAW